MTPAARVAIDTFTRSGAVYRFLSRNPPVETEYLGDQYWAGFRDPHAPVPAGCLAGSQAAQAWLAGQDAVRSLPQRLALAGEAQGARPRRAD